MMELRVLPTTTDDVSTVADRAWNANLLGDSESHYGRLMEYVRGVAQLGEQLEEVARQYGIDEEESAASVKQSGEHA